MIRFIETSTTDGYWINEDGEKVTTQDEFQAKCEINGDVIVKMISKHHRSGEGVEIGTQPLYKSNEDECYCDWIEIV